MPLPLLVIAHSPCLQSYCVDYRYFVFITPMPDPQLALDWLESVSTTSNRVEREDGALQVGATNSSKLIVRPLKSMIPAKKRGWR